MEFRYIYTFNYTSIIEKIFGDVQRNVVLANRANKTLVILREIKHIHGYLDHDMVIGVNDTSQIKNDTFHNNIDVLESLVKSECNNANRNNVDKEFTNKINSANLICIFGSSIGDTDDKWWELIGARLKSDCHLIIFSKGDQIDSRANYMKARIERSLKDLFLNKTKLTEEERKSIKEKIFIGLNTSMFSGLIIKD